MAKEQRGNHPREQQDRATILLVDDKPDKLLALTTVLEELGTNIVTAHSGREALRLLLKDDYALILLDVSMPDIDGFETASLIRQRKRTEYTPIIFITSINTNETHVTRGYSLGAVDYIFSPIQPEILKAKVGVFIELYDKNLQVKRQAEQLRRQAERRASSLESRLQTLLSTLGVGVFRVSEEGLLLEANQPFLEHLGLESFEEASQFDLGALGLGHRFIDAESDGSRDSWRDLEWTRRDGSKIWLAMTQTVLHDEEGRRSIQGLIDDVTRRKTAEEELKTLNDNLEQKVRERTEALSISQRLARRSERLASLGTLAAGIAHEINNPLNSILMSTDFALRSGKPEVVEDILKKIAEETRRCGKIVKGVLQFARDEKNLKSVNDLSVVVQHGVELAQTYVKSPLTIHLNLAPHPVLALLNPTEIEQIIINLIQNSVEATTAETHIWITTARRSGRALLTFEDNGPGIPDSMQMKIFDPFYSTKTETGGTGLGLSVVHGIITEHGGSITVKNGQTGGARFEIEIPLVQMESADTGNHHRDADERLSNRAAS